MEKTLSAGNPLGTEKISKLLFRYSFPSIIAMLVSSLYNIVDQIFIGQGLGYLGNGATTVVFPLSTICLAIALLLGVGGASCYSLQLGEGRPDEAARTAGTALSFMFLSGLIYLVLGELSITALLPVFGATPENYGYALEYSRVILLGMPFLIVSNGISQLCRADGSPSFSMFFMVVGAIVNCILDPIFIFVFHWGMAGAAWATIIGQIVSFVIALFYLPRFKHVHMNADSFKIRMAPLKKICNLGMASALNQAAVLVVQIFLTNMFKYYGSLSIYGANIPIAASGVAFKLNGLFISVIVGIAQGLQPIVGYNYGAAQYGRVKECMVKGLISVVVLGTLVEVLFQCFPRPLILLFGTGDELYVRFGVIMLRVYLMGICIQGVQSLSSTYFAAIGQPGKGVFVSLSRTIIFFIPLAFVFSLMWGIEGLVVSQPIADLLSALLAFILVLRSWKQMKQLKEGVIENRF